MRSLATTLTTLCYLLSLAAISSLSASSYSGPNGQYYYDVYLQDIDATCPVMMYRCYAESVSVDGSLTAFETRISRLRINGSAHLDHCSDLYDTQVYGPLYANSCEFQGELLVHGSLRAEKSYIQDMVIAGSHTVLSDSHVDGSVTIMRLHDREPAVLYLNDGATVSGVLCFVDGDGTVFVDSADQVGSIVLGGTVVVAEPEEQEDSPEIDE